MIQIPVIKTRSEQIGKNLEDYFKPIPYLKPLLDLPLPPVREEESVNNLLMENQQLSTALLEVKGIFTVRKILNEAETKEFLSSRCCGAKGGQNIGTEKAKDKDVEEQNGRHRSQSEHSSFPEGKASFDNMVREMTKKRSESPFS